MDFETEQRWQKVQLYLKELTGEAPDVTAAVFLIGVQELGKGYKKFSKDKKLDLIHIGICTILEPYGFYKYIGTDSDGWPHYENIKKLPPLEERQQQLLLKQAIADYFGY